MAPAKVLRKSGYPGLVRPRFDKPDHVKEILPAEAGTVIGGQLSRQCRDNLVSIVSSGCSQNVGPNSIPDLPIKYDEFRVDGLRHSESGSLNKTTQICCKFRRGAGKQYSLLLGFVSAFIARLTLPSSPFPTQ